MHHSTKSLYFKVSWWTSTINNLVVSSTAEWVMEWKGWPKPTLDFGPVLNVHQTRIWIISATSLTRTYNIRTLGYVGSLNQHKHHPRPYLILKSIILSFPKFLSPTLSTGAYCLPWDMTIYDGGLQTDNLQKLLVSGASRCHYFYIKA